MNDMTPPTASLRDRMLKSAGDCPCDQCALMREAAAALSARQQGEAVTAFDGARAGVVTLSETPKDVVTIEFDLRENHLRVYGDGRLFAQAAPLLVGAPTPPADTAALLALADEMTQRAPWPPAFKGQIVCVGSEIVREWAERLRAHATGANQDELRGIATPPESARTLDPKITEKWESREYGCSEEHVSVAPESAQEDHWREMYRFERAMRLMDNGMARESAFAAANREVAASPEPPAAAVSEPAHIPDSSESAHEAKPAAQEGDALLTEVMHELTAMATKTDVSVRLNRAQSILDKVRRLAQPEKPVAWWNGISPGFDGEGNVSVRWGADAENSRHDIPLYAGYNPIHHQPSRAQPVGEVDESIRKFVRDARSWLDSRAENARPGWMVAQLPVVEAALNAARLPGAGGGEAGEVKSPSYDALLLIAQSVCGALERAGLTDCDDPGEAIDVIRERLERRIAELEAASFDAEAVAWAYGKLRDFGCYSSETGAQWGDRLNLMLMQAPLRTDSSEEAGSRD